MNTTFLVVILFVLSALIVLAVTCVKRRNRKRVAIILTMYTKGKEDMYIKNVKRWLNETTFDIYTVDSANQGVPLTSSRLFQTVFKQEGVGKSSTYYEVQSLNQVHNRYKKQLLSYDYIFKITGKYVVPQLNNYLPDTKCDLIFQSRYSQVWQNSELFGIRASRFTEILNVITSYKDILFEQILHNLKTNYTYVILKPLYLDQRIPRAAGDVLEYL